MTRYQILGLAESVWGSTNPDVGSAIWEEYVLRLAELVAMSERNRCANLAEDFDIGRASNHGKCIATLLRKGHDNAVC